MENAADLWIYLTVFNSIVISIKLLSGIWKRVDGEIAAHEAISEELEGD